MSCQSRRSQRPHPSPPSRRRHTRLRFRATHPRRARLQTPCRRLIQAQGRVRFRGQEYRRLRFPPPPPRSGEP